MPMSSLKDTVGLLDFRSFDWKDTGYNSGGGITPPGLMNPVYICTITVRFSFFIFFFFFCSQTKGYQCICIFWHMTREQPYVTATDIFITDLKNLYLNALS